MKKEYLFLRKEELKGKKEGDTMSYLQLIKHYTEGNIILNNEVMANTLNIGEWEIYNGYDYDEEEDYYPEVYQYFIIDSNSAERLARDTDELIYYNETLNLYLLGVTHFGTAWDGVATKYKITENLYKYLGVKED